MKHTVVIHTITGARHEFSGVEDADVLRIRTPGFMEVINSLILSNMEGACLTMPSRMVAHVLVDGETAWKSKHSAA